jgi:tetratricopeptide (TPR) repeat protein
MRSLPALASAAAVVLLGGCGVVRDMRAEYVANRAYGEATAELQSRAPHLERVRRSLDLAYRLRRDDAGFVGRLAPLYQSAGGYERAIRCYEAAGKANGDTYDDQIGYCLLKLGKTQAGTERVLAAVEKASNALAAHQATPAEYANALNDAGYALADAGVRLDEAFDLVQEAVHLEPGVPAYTDSLGWAYYRRGDYLDAAFHLERAARLIGHRDSEVLWHLGAVHAAQGKLRRAQGELTEALELDPSNAEARRKLRDMLRELPPPATA